MVQRKQAKDCKMPECKKKLKAVALVASLKHKPDLSNTTELAQLVAKNLKEYKVETEIVRLVDYNILAGLKHREGKNDDWPKIAEKIRGADILLFCTPIWWGGLSSVMQRVIERMDALDEDYIRTGKSILYNKVGGIVITGSEDGALNIIGNICMFLLWMGITVPPEAAAYWVGEVGQDPKNDRAKRLKNQSTQTMAKNCARNLVFYAKLLANNPLKTK